jgi:hypothetical protein
VRRFRALRLLLCLALLQACTKEGTHAANRAELPPILTKDEVAVVDGRPFSISDFQTVQARLTHPSTSSIVWVGTAVLALQSQSRNQGTEISSSAALEIARFALGELTRAKAEPALRQLPPPSAVSDSLSARITLNHAISSSVVRRNESLIALLRVPEPSVD